MHMRRGFLAGLGKTAGLAAEEADKAICLGADISTRACSPASRTAVPRGLGPSATLDVNGAPR